MIKFINKSNIKFVNLDLAKELVNKDDDYTNILTKFDLQAKIRTFSNLVTHKDYLINAQRYLQNWEQYEIEYLSQIINNTRKKIDKLNLRFTLPEDIFIVKSGMYEEGGANGFTRQNYIVLNKNSYSENLFEHELFHITSRYNDKLIDKAYGILGFTKCNEIEIPEELSEYKITNPDAPYNNYYIDLKINGQAEEAIMIIYGNRDYEGGSFFNYINKRLLLIEGNEGYKKVKRDSDGKIMLFEYEETDNLFDLIGKNTGYNIHQEEITADHFIMVLNQTKDLPNQELVNELENIMKNN